MAIKGTFFIVAVTLVYASLSLESRTFSIIAIWEANVSKIINLVYFCLIATALIHLSSPMFCCKQQEETRQYVQHLV